MKSILITGGAGFIGVNTARYFGNKGWVVTVLDNLSRRGSRDNLDWLRRTIQMRFEQVDIRDQATIERLIAEIRPDMVLHLAGQVAVTASVTDPGQDFEINAVGSFNVLDAIRRGSPESFYLNASTNKLYGKMEDLGIIERDGRYEYDDLIEGVTENRPLDFHSPYGCSKGVADQYTIDYARIYGLKTASFRQSCIYGPRQFGIEDQGWVAWFAIAAVLGKQITIYGNGKQVRDILHVSDLARAYELAYENRDRIAGQALNIGGGPDNTLSLLELVSILEGELGSKIPLTHSEGRPGDQPVFVCNLAKAHALLNWSPKIAVREGVHNLVTWVRDNRDLLASSPTTFVSPTCL